MFTIVRKFPKDFIMQVRESVMWLLKEIMERSFLSESFT